MLTCFSYSKGVFVFALYAMTQAPCSKHIAQLFHRYHNKQSVQYTGNKHGKLSSILDPFLPGPVIRNLELQGPEGFMAFIEGDTRKSDLIWTPEHRKMLNAQVLALVNPFRDQLKKNPHLVWLKICAV